MNDDHELSPAARALLTEAAGGDDPSPKDRARVRRALMATIAGSAGLAASSAASSAAASATAAGTVATGASISLTVKIAAVVLVVGAVSGTVAVAPWEPDEPAIAAHEAIARATLVEQGSAADHALEVAQPAPAEIPEVIEEPSPSPSPVVDEEVIPPTTASAVPAPRAPPRGPIATRSPREPSTLAPPALVVPEPAPVASPSTLAEEMRILRSAQSALSAGDPDSALARLAEHARRFPTGAMVEEREAARIVALCRAGRREEARTAAATFLRERPTSPLAARVRTSCD